MAIDIFEKTNPEVFVLSGFFSFTTWRTGWMWFFGVLSFSFYLCILVESCSVFDISTFLFVILFFSLASLQTRREIINEVANSCRPIRPTRQHDFFFPFSTKRINSDTDAVFCVCYRLTFTTWSGFFVNKEGETDEKEIPRKCLARSSRNCWRFFPCKSALASKKSGNLLLFNPAPSLYALSALWCPAVHITSLAKTRKIKTDELCAERALSTRIAD